MEFLNDEQLPKEESIFLKLEDKEEITGVFRGKFYYFYNHYLKNEGKSYLCTGKEQGCPYCPKSKPSFRFKVNLVTRNSNGEFIAKVFESGITIYRHLKELNKKYEDLNKVFITLARHGLSTNTTYSVIPLPKWQLTQGAEAIISQVPLHELKHAQMKDKETESVSQGMGDDEIPF